MSDRPTFTVVVTCEVDMTAADVWPDNDGPKDPTADDVAEAMQAYMNTRMCSVRKMLDDWCLLDDLEVGVQGPGFDGEPTYARVER